MKCFTKNLTTLIALTLALGAGGCMVDATDERDDLAAEEHAADLEGEWLEEDPSAEDEAVYDEELGDPGAELGSHVVVNPLGGEQVNAAFANASDEEDGEDRDDTSNPEPTPWKAMGNPEPTPWNPDEEEEPDPQPWNP